MWVLEYILLKHSLCVITVLCAVEPSSVHAWVHSLENAMLPQVLPELIQLPILKTQCEIGMLNSRGLIILYQPSLQRQMFKTASSWEIHFSFLVKYHIYTEKLLLMSILWRRVVVKGLSNPRFPLSFVYVWIWKRKKQNKTKMLAFISAKISYT